MSTLLLIILGVYVAGLLAFIIAVLLEAPKHGSKVGVAHFVVGVIWPAWALWYLWVITSDWFERRRKASRRK